VPDIPPGANLPADLAAALAVARPQLAPLVSTVMYLPTTPSTNDIAAQYATAEHEGLVVLADEQTAGRGRRGHTWHSPPLAGLYVSVVLAPSRARDPRRAKGLLTIAAGLAIAEAIHSATEIAPEIKWPNDLLIRGRKVCGMLAEASTEVVLGYGINVARTAYPAEFADHATSLETELGRPADRALVFAESLAALARRYRDLLDGRFDAILDGWRARAPGSAGVLVAWNTSTGPQTGTTVGIDDAGALLVRVGDRLERLTAGEISELRT
jgi:BirA family transcriptional regulator, biotin operon repressor / biotin---[acetyl-CoA-carboxylase] ligase